jgi:hypothetical protein
LHFGKTELFFQGGLDKRFILSSAHSLICPSGKIKVARIILIKSGIGVGHAELSHPHGGIIG